MHSLASSHPSTAASRMHPSRSPRRTLIIGCSEWLCLFDAIHGPHVASMDSASMDSPMFAAKSVLFYDVTQSLCPILILILYTVSLYILILVV